MVGDLGRFAEMKADAMADELIDDRAALGMGVIGDDFADFTDQNAGL